MNPATTTTTFFDLCPLPLLAFLLFLRRKKRGEEAFSSSRQTWLRNDFLDLSSEEREWKKRKKSFTEIFFLFQPSKKVSFSSPRAFVLVMVAAESAECFELCGEVCFFLSFLRVLDEETLRWLAWQYDDCEEMETGKNGAKKNDGVPKGQRSIIPYAEIESR